MVEKPPYTITPDILSRVERIGEMIGRAETAGVSQDLRLRRINRIRTIHGSLAIEGNILSEEEIATILDGKPVAAPPRDIEEARNAIRAYDQFQRWDPANEADLLFAHKILMASLLYAPGRYRHGKVAVVGRDEIHHIGPPAERVPRLMTNLLAWLSSTDEHPLIASSIFHYEFEFIHPFDDGNGRMGRLWQTLILTRWKRCLPISPWRAWFMPAKLTTTRPSGRARRRARARSLLRLCWKSLSRRFGFRQQATKIPTRLATR